MVRTQKWVFEGQTRPNKNLDLRDQIGLIWGEEQTVKAKKRRGRGRRRREEEEEGSSQKGMETTLSMDFVWITWNLRLDMVNILSLNLGFDRIAFSPWIS